MGERESSLEMKHAFLTAQSNYLEEKLVGVGSKLSRTGTTEKGKDKIQVEVEKICGAQKSQKQANMKTTKERAP